MTSSRKKLKSVIAEKVNATFPSHFHPPYKPGTKVTRFRTGEEERFVRFHGDKNKLGAWVVKARAIRALSPAEMQRKYALPQIPTLLTEVVVPKGTRMEYGTVNPGLVGVATWPTRSRQYRLLDRLENSAFRNTRPL
jgi:filamentous hemagglutinin